MKIEISLQGKYYTEKTGRTILGFGGCLDIFGKGSNLPLAVDPVCPWLLCPYRRIRPAYSIDILFLNTAMPT